MIDPEVGLHGIPQLKDTCQDIDECATQCQGFGQRCLNSPGSYSCECDLGFEKTEYGK